jgi:hypothetical protein
MMQCAVTIDLSSQAAAVGTIEKAIHHRAKPRSWRVSEYVVTKVKAKEVAARIAEQIAAGAPVVLDLFDWHIIQGELARFAQRRHDENALGLFCAILAGIKANPDAARRESRVNELRRAEKRQRRAEAKIERLRSQIQQEELDAQMLRQLAALPCGGCRKPSCGHCCYALGLGDN